MQRGKRAAKATLAGIGIAPRGLSVNEAAAYVGLSRNQFLRYVDRGIYPTAMPLPGRERVWDRQALDAAMDGKEHKRAADDIEAAIGEIEAGA